MIPSAGRTVHYRLTTDDLFTANERVSGRVGSLHHEGDVVPMLIVRIHADEPDEATPVNGQAFVDGNFSLWVTSRVQGTEPGQWSDPRS